VTAPTLPHLYSGKVRDLYAVDDDRLLMVASDRVSVFDVILPDPIPDKGRVLTAVSAFWFEQTRDLVPNHVLTVDPAEFPVEAGDEIGGRAMVVERTDPIRLECVARGYLFGSAWSEYDATGGAYGNNLPSGLRQAEKLATPLFTSTTKALVGHDEALTDAQAVELIGADCFDAVRTHTLALYTHAAAHAETRGVILADTKLEFGVRPDGTVIVIDEMFTPDSSRYWPADAWRPGMSPPSFDKQYVRDHMDALGWDHTPPVPSVPAEVIAGTRARYIDAYERITGRSFADWYR
jgi:phosphoribosylaminoimidazole-succinocarboxamide synthase